MKKILKELFGKFVRKCQKEIHGELLQETLMDFLHKCLMGNSVMPDGNAEVANEASSSIPMQTLLVIPPRIAIENMTNRRITSNFPTT